MYIKKALIAHYTDHTIKSGYVLAFVNPINAASPKITKTAIFPPFPFDFWHNTNLTFF